MTYGEMKKLRENIVILLACILVLGAGVWYAMGGERYGTTEARIIQGVVQSVSTSAGVLTIATPAQEIIDIAITGETKLKNKNNQEVGLEYFEKGFELEVKGILQNKSALHAVKITILKEPNIVVFVPRPGQNVGKNFTIEGISRTFENNVLARVKNARTGTLYFRNFTTADAPDVGKFGNYIFNVVLNGNTIQEGDELIAEVFEESAKDGSEINKVAVQLIFRQAAQTNPREVQNETKKIKVYFGNSEKDPKASCELTFSVERSIENTKAVGTAALKELLKGPTEEEKTEGYFTSINEGVKIQNLRVRGGVAYADFSDELERAVGGSCRVGFIRAQIRDTLKQFFTVQSVIISINGRTEDILQP